MKKALLVAAMLILMFTVKGQSIYRGLIGYSYEETTYNGNVKLTHKPIIIIYNNNFCLLNINGLTKTFPVDSYAQTLNKGDIEESFLSDEDYTEPRGWYSINIIHRKKGKNEITINLPMMSSGKAYFCENALLYSENGRVKSNAHVNNWKALEERYNVGNSQQEQSKIMSKAIPEYDIQVFFNKNFTWFQDQSEHIDSGLLKLRLQIDTLGSVGFISIGDDSYITDPKQNRSTMLGQIYHIINLMPKWIPAKERNGHPQKSNVEVEIKLKSVSDN